ncbi:MAG: F0F1 ATP synthase subunit epsilon [Methylovirgula sp.]|jgi:F-type H+-transporting ATPase subunit epsilon
MPPPFPFELVAPERLIFAGEVEAVVVPGTEGEFTVLKDHAPLMSMLRPGVLEIDLSAAEKQKLFVRGGFAEVSPSGLIVLAEQAIALEELNAAELDAALKDAEEDIADAPTDEKRRVATEKRDHLRELRAALQI